MEPVERQVETNNLTFADTLNEFFSFTYWHPPELMNLDWSIVECVLQGNRDTMQPASFTVKVDLIHITP
jgi:hypothetical protein